MVNVREKWSIMLLLQGPLRLAETVRKIITREIPVQHLVRLAVNPHYRLVEPRDLQNGAVIYVVNMTSAFEVLCPFRKFRLDRGQACRTDNGSPAVFGKIIIPARVENEDMFVSMDNILSITERDNTQYWVPVEG